MSGFENMQTRLNYAGGAKQVTRMNEDKLRSLKKALLYSYQSATAILADGREFKCLINPDKLKESYDNKIVSIPFEDVCLNKEKTGKTIDGIESIGMKAGDVFKWKENETDWIVYLQRLEETAYFRAEIRRCQYEVEVDGKVYKVYARGPEEDSMVWNKQSGIEWNDINYTLEMYITKDELTEEFFHRFSKIKLNNKPWEVQAIDNMSTDGIIIVALKEDYQNSIEEAVIKETEKNNPKDLPDWTDSYIEGPDLVYPYDVVKYTIRNAEGGSWICSDETQAVIGSSSETEVKLGIQSLGGNFNLIYRRENEEDIVLPITIDTL